MRSYVVILSELYIDTFLILYLIRCASVEVQLYFNYMQLAGTELHEEQPCPHINNLYALHSLSPPSRRPRTRTNNLCCIVPSASSKEEFLYIYLYACECMIFCKVIVKNGHVFRSRSYLLRSHGCPEI